MSFNTGIPSDQNVRKLKNSARSAFYINLVVQALGIIYVGLMKKNLSHACYTFTTHYIYEYVMFDVATLPLGGI
jgi:hypothetical protein